MDHTIHHHIWENSHMNKLDMTPHPCPDCGKDLRSGVLEIRTGVTETHTWKANRFFRPGDWYLAMTESDGAETMRWVCAACGAVLPEDLAMLLGQIIYAG